MIKNKNGNFSHQSVLLFFTKTPVIKLTEFTPITQQYVICTYRYCSFTVLTTLRDFTLDGRTYYIIQIKQGSNASKNPTCLLLVQCTCDL